MRNERVLVRESRKTSGLIDGLVSIAWNAFSRYLPRSAFSALSQLHKQRYQPTNFRRRGLDRRPSVLAVVASSINWFTSRGAAIFCSRISISLIVASRRRVIRQRATYSAFEQPYSSASDRPRERKQTINTEMQSTCKIIKRSLVCSLRNKL